MQNYNSLSSLDITNSAKNVQANQRRTLIMNQLLMNEYASVQELSRLLNVSVVTVRSDLAALKKSGLIERTHGGARMLDKELLGEIGFQVRASMHQDQKKRIGAKAVELINDGDAIILDSSTTCFHLARNLKFMHDLKIVTNGLNTAQELIKQVHTTILIGGMLNEKTYGSVGRLGRNTLSEVRVQKAFFGARGVTLRDGLTDANLLEVELKKAMVEISDQVYVLVDSSKFNVVGFSSFASIDHVTAIVTDDGIDPVVRETFENNGIKIIVA